MTAVLVTEAMPTKRCRGIGRPEHVLPVDQFRKSRTNAGGLQKLCIECHKANMKLSRERLKARTPEEVVAQQAVGTKTCRRCISVGRVGDRPVVDFHVARNHRDGKRAHCRDCVRELRWKRTGIVDMTVERWNTMYALQGGVCAIPSCGSHGVDRLLDVDHDHATGAVRGLLCRNCNTGIGALRESPQIFAEVLEYLKRASSSPPGP